MDSIDLTVAVCTRNNARQLASLLASLEELRIPQGVTWEVVLVDNCSTDGTRDVAAAWLDKLPLRVVYEPTVGLGGARNRAVDEARGQLICWTDDDVIVPPDWLEVYWRAARRHDKAAVFGGRIEPMAEPPVTRWFAARMHRGPLSSVTARRDLGNRELLLASPADAVLWGANYAARADALRRHRFDTKLSFGEETDVIERVLASGATGWWLPESRVTHVIRPERQTRRFVAQYFRRAGWTAAFYFERARESGAEPVRPDRWLAANPWLLRNVALASRWIAAAARASLMIDAELRALARANYLRGILQFRNGEQAWNPTVSP